MFFAVCDVSIISILINISFIIPALKKNKNNGNLFFKAGCCANDQAADESNDNDYYSSGTRLALNCGYMCASRINITFSYLKTYSPGSSTITEIRQWLGVMVTAAVFLSECSKIFQ